MRTFVFLSFLILTLGTILAGLVGYYGPDALVETQRWIGWIGFAAILLSLSIQPLMHFFQAKRLWPLKRDLGLIGFCLCVVHFLFYHIDHQLDVSSLMEDLLHRRHLSFGLLALFILSLLAITSNKRSQKALGVRWKQLHRSVYLVIILLAIHIILSKKVTVIFDLWPILVVTLVLLVRLQSVKSRVVRFVQALTRKKTL